MPLTILPEPTVPERLSAVPAVGVPVSQTTSPEPVAVGIGGGRDLTVDMVRAIAMVLVAVGHWLVVVPRFDNGEFGGVNALETVPLMGQLTWLFQVMPLFFAVGGFAGAASWRSARRRNVPYPEWLRTRLVRLLRPTLVLLGFWTAALAIGQASGADIELMGVLGWLVVVPVWFLSVYVVVTALVPAFLAAHERWGAAVLVALAAGAVLVDVLRLAGGTDVVSYSNFFFVFLFAQQLGFFWADGRVTQPLRWLAVGIGSMWLLTHVGPYPVSMVGVPGADLANNAPPTICLIGLGVAQVGAAVAARPLLERLLRRRSVQAATLVLNMNAMTILLWHFSALAVTAMVLLPAGLVPVFADGTGPWWLVRLGSVVVLTPVLAGVVAVVGRFERNAVKPRSSAGPAPGTCTSPWPTARLAGAVVLLAAGFGTIAFTGLSVGATLYGLPLTTAALIGSGTTLVAIRS